MPQEIRMPALGQTTEELRIIAWFKQEGDKVEIGEPLLEVETDKATLEVESFASGTLLKILRGEDEVVEASELLAYIGAPGEAIPERVIGSSDSQSPNHPITQLPNHPVIQSPALLTSPAGEKILASPAARQLAKERGIDLSQVRGSGPDGRIERQDVLTFIERERT